MYNQITLWDSPVEVLSPVGKSVIKVDGEVIFYDSFFASEESDRFFEELYAEVNWQQETIKLFGRSTPLPRLTAWYGDSGKVYIYSGIRQEPAPWTPTLLHIKERVEIVSKAEFNCVLLNLYRHGSDGVFWHSDDEPELGKNPVIGSVSFGSTRRFSLRHKQSKERKVDIDLTHGSFLLMKGTTQHHWQHQIAKTKKQVKPRINLTFRFIH